MPLFCRFLRCCFFFSRIFSSFGVCASPCFSHKLKLCALNSCISFSVHLAALRLPQPLQIVLHSRPQQAARPDGHFHFLQLFEGNVLHCRNAGVSEATEGCKKWSKAFELGVRAQGVEKFHLFQQTTKDKKLEKKKGNEDRRPNILETFCGNLALGSGFEDGGGGSASSLMFSWSSRKQGRKKGEKTRMKR